MQKFTFRLVEDGTYMITGYQGDEESVVIPSDYHGAKITIIGDKVFRGHREIKEILIPDTVTDLGEFVFDGCEQLRHIDLPGDLRYLWGYTFVRCGLEEIVIPDRVNRIPSYAFKDCKRLTKVICGKNMKKIDAWAFGGCDRLKEIECLPEVEISEKDREDNPAIQRLF